MVVYRVLATGRFHLPHPKNVINVFGLVAKCGFNMPPNDPLNLNFPCRVPHQSQLCEECFGVMDRIQLEVFRARYQRDRDGQLVYA
jgi:hypothetical protein